MLYQYYFEISGRGKIKPGGANVLNIHNNCDEQRHLDDFNNNFKDSGRWATQ